MQLNSVFPSQNIEETIFSVIVENIVTCRAEVWKMTKQLKNKMKVMEI